MIRVLLEQPEVETLRETLHSFISELRMEIADTDSLDFRNQIRHRKQMLENVLRHLDEAEQGESAGAAH